MSNEMYVFPETAVKQSHTFNNNKRRQALIMSCEHCPMVWFQKLLSEIEGSYPKI